MNQKPHDAAPTSGRRNFLSRLGAASFFVFVLLCAALFVSLRATRALEQSAGSSTSHSGPAQDYLVYVVCESGDRVVLLRFGPKGLAIERQTHIGLLPMGDINGPHGIAVSPDKQFVYVSLGHGQPNGSLWKLKAGTDEVVRYTPLGLFPATADISRDGEFIYVANANFHGDMVPSSISVVATGRDGGSKAHHHLHDAARLPLESTGHKALFGVHDGRHAGGN